MFLCTTNENVKKEIKKTILFTIVSKRELWELSPEEKGKVDDASQPCLNPTGRALVGASPKYSIPLADGSALRHFSEHLPVSLPGLLSSSVDFAVWQMEGDYAS